MRKFSGNAKQRRVARRSVERQLKAFGRWFDRNSQKMVEGIFRSNPLVTRLMQKQDIQQKWADTVFQIPVKPSMTIDQWMKEKKPC